MNVLCSHHFSKGKIHVPNIWLWLTADARKGGWYYSIQVQLALYEVLHNWLRMVQFLSVSILGIYKASITLVYLSSLKNAPTPGGMMQIQAEAQVQSSRGRSQEAPQLCYRCCWAPGHLLWPRNISTYLSAGRRYPTPQVQLHWWGTWKGKIMEKATIQ